MTEPRDPDVPHSGPGPAEEEIQDDEQRRVQEENAGTSLDEPSDGSGGE